MLFILLVGCPPYDSPKHDAFAFLSFESSAADAGHRLDWLIYSYCFNLGHRCPSYAAMDLLRGMLAIKPSHRLTLEQIASHRWLRGGQD